MAKDRKKLIPKPTEAELRILRVLWTRGPSSVREVHHALSDERDTGYSTALKMLQVMHAKGLVLRDESNRPQIYRAASSEPATQKRLVDDLVHRAFGGAAGKLLIQALSSKRVSSGELTEIKQLIERLEKESL